MHDYHDITSKTLLEGERANLGEEDLAESLERIKVVEASAEQSDSV